MRGLIGILILTILLSAPRAVAQSPLECVATAIQSELANGNRSKLIELKDHDGNVQQMEILGRQMPNGDFLVYVHDTRQVFVVPANEIQSRGDEREIPRIRAQDKPDCAVHSTANCLTLLSKAGLLPESRIKTLMKEDPDRLFQLLHENVSAESWEEFYQAENWWRFSRNLLKDPSSQARIERFERMGYTQADRRKNLFEASGLSVEITHDANQVAEHLRKGHPVILDLPVAYEKPLHVEGGSLHTHELADSLSFKPTRHDSPDYAGWHSVLAIGMTTVGNKVIVLDSARGAMNLWDLSDVKRAIDTPYSLAASLVSPARESASVFDQEEPIYVLGGTLPEAITFSFDAEIPHADIFREILKDRSGMSLNELKTALQSLKLPATTVESLGKELKLSPAQLKNFALRKPSPALRPTDPVSITDLKPRYFGELLTTRLTSLDIPGPAKRDFLRRYLAIANRWVSRIPAAGQATLDGQWVEIPHASYEFSPKKFKDDLEDGLFKKFDQPQTHLHIGIPASVPNPQMLSIARAIEAREILRIAGDEDDPEDFFTSHVFSSLNPNPIWQEEPLGESGRAIGVLRLHFSRWKKPFVAHDLELRAYLSHEDGFSDLSLAARLAQNHERLLEVSNLPAWKNDDPKTLNLKGALYYAGHILEQSSDQSHREIGKGLLGFVAEIKKEKTISSSLRQRLKVFLTSNSVDELLGNPRTWIH